MNLQEIVFSEVKEELLVILWELSQRRTEGFYRDAQRKTTRCDSVTSPWTLCNEL